MFAIVDIETTGGSSTNSKITEIAVIIHNGLSVEKKFSTLINPESKIPYNIIRLTGITNEMVADAPKFYEVAKDLVELFKDKIFIAHNVGFDYGFIKQEYKNLGFEFNMPKLCTVQLSRKLLPGHRSYSLGNLCGELGIGNSARHRAEGDAVATTELFELLLKVKSEHPQYKNFGIDQLTRKISYVKSNSLIEKLPEETGVYYFRDSKGEIIYIGKSKNMRNRAYSHFRNSSSKKSMNMMNSITDVDFVVTGSELLALLLESHEIKLHKPLFNRAKRRSSFSYGIEAYDDFDVYKKLRVVKNTKENAPFITFTTADAAKEYLNNLVDEYELCQKLSGLYETDQACFSYQVKKCKGACIAAEPAAEYNKRVAKAVKNSGLNSRSFFMIDKGRSAEENAVVQVENGKFIGFGYVSRSEVISGPAGFQNFIEKYPDDRDAQQIIKYFLSDRSVKKIFYKGE